MKRYEVNQQLIQNLLSWVSSGAIAIPEIQRPFVWDATKVRDLMDSLYKGFPIGYIIAWQNPNIRLKDGSMSVGKKILIDGQQRVTALTVAVLRQYVFNRNYKHVKIKIAFNPLTETFEVQNPAIKKDKAWLSALVAGLVYGSIMGFKPFYRMRFNARRAIIATAVFVTLWCLIAYCMDSPIHLRPLLFLSGVAALLGGFVENKKKP